MRLLSNMVMIVALALLVTLTAQSAWAQAPQEAPKPPVEERELPPGTGFIPPPLDLSHLTGQELPERFKDLPPPPALWDWRAQGKVTPVKNQSVCGACYAFASLANIESKMLIDGAGTYDFSENNAKECNWYQTSCTASNYYNLASWFSQKGTVLESCDPYVASDVSCNSSCPYIKTLLDWRVISANSVPAYTVLQNYIYTYGPCYTTLYVGDSSDTNWRDEFASYSGDSTLYYTGSYAPNHAVCIVGWDDTLSHLGGQGAWIVKNSWGTGWGGTCGYGSESGYFTIAYGSAGIGKWSSYMHNWQSYDTNGELLYYDEGGWTNNWGYPGNTTAWGMCKFVPSSACSLKRVEFWTNDVTTDIDVYVYDTYSGGALSSLLDSSKNHSYSEVGYHSVALGSPPYVTGGNDVYVAVKFTNSMYQSPIVADDQGPDTIATTYTSLSGNNGTWFDLGSTGYDNDVAIRLRTTTGATAPAITVVPDTLKFGQVQVGSDSSQTLRVKSTGTDTLRVTDINPSSGVVSVSDTAFNLAPSESTDVTVTFTPAAVQSYSEALTIMHNAKGTTIVPVLGEGVSAGVPGIAVVPDTLRFGQVEVGSDSSQTLRVKSTGTDTLQVTDINSSDPSVTVSDTAFSLAPSESTDVTVTFTPAAVQSYSEALTILHNAKGTTIVPVTGTGVFGKPEVSSIILSDPSPTAAGEVDFAITFNCKMDRGVTPSASYGLTSPYDAQAIVAGPGWSVDSTTWTGRDTIQASIGDGLNTIRIEGAQGATGLVMDPDTSWTFFIDTAAPTSQACSPAYVGTNSFEVSWSGADPAPASGIATYTVLVLVDGQFPAVWISGTADTSAVYSGANGHFYSFYSVATDGAGNEEPVPGAPDCTTYVDTTPPAVPALISPADDFITGDNTPTLIWGKVSKGLRGANRSGDTPGNAKTPVTYQLQTARDLGFSDLVVDISGLSDTSFTMGSSLADTSYFWHVQATDMAQHSSGFQAAPFKFTVDTQSPVISTTIWPDTSFGGPFLIESAIADRSGIALALLWYRTDRDTIWQADTMQVLMPPSPPPTHWGIIPEQTTPNTVVEYYVYAEDGAIPANCQTDPVGAPGGGVYSFTSYVTGVPEDRPFSGVPKEFTLFQNYPDPFNADTEILFGLPKSCQVRLEIFNVLGQRVIILTDEYWLAGYHAVRWDGKDAVGQSVASGIYLYRLQVERYSRIRKMVLLR